MSESPGDPETPLFPIKSSKNRRYLVDQREVPFFFLADTAWWLIMQLSGREAERYFRDRRGKGFNAIQLHLINKEKIGSKTRDGLSPFSPEEDLTRPSEAYWQRVDDILERATAHGFLLVVSAAWLGWRGQDWRKNLDPESAYHYGRFIGFRYAKLGNIVWILGGDNDPGDRRTSIAGLARGLQETAPHHPLTYHAAAEHASAIFFAGEPWLKLNLAYTYVESYLLVSSEYWRPEPPRPIILGETGYEKEANTGFVWTPYLVRRQVYWALLSGACGYSHGSGGVYQFGDGWVDALDFVSTTQMSHVRALFTSHEWWKLAPVHSGVFCVDGSGMFGSDTYATAALSEDHRLGLIYLPSPRTVTIDMTCLAGSARASWFDPTSGRLQLISGSLDNSGRRAFTPLALNLAGEGDWVLVIECPRSGEALQKPA